MVSDAQIETSQRDVSQRPSTDLPVRKDLPVRNSQLRKVPVRYSKGPLFRKSILTAVICDRVMVEIRVRLGLGLGLSAIADVRNSGHSEQRTTILRGTAG